VQRRAALVTGASRGIGRAIATRLAAEGFDLTITSRTRGALDELAADLSPATAHVVPGDMSSEDDVARVADEHLARFGRLDVLVLNAGTGTVTPIEETSPARFEKQLRVNLHSPFQLIARCLPAMRETAKSNRRLGARIIAIASVTGIASEPGMSVYGASKAALISLCESVNVEASADGVSATSISPGYVDTDMSEWIHDRIAPDTMITVDDIAELAVAMTRLSANAVVPNITVVRPGDNLWRA
jgi:3-oxoacyl-[acyl-carrier protein] reductase